MGKCQVGLSNDISGVTIPCIVGVATFVNSIYILQNQCFDE